MLLVSSFYLLPITTRIKKPYFQQENFISFSAHNKNNICTFVNNLLLLLAPFLELPFYVLEGNVLEVIPFSERENRNRCQRIFTCIIFMTTSCITLYKIIYPCYTYGFLTFSKCLVAC